jgi:hypothetical protein
VVRRLQYRLVLRGTFNLVLLYIFFWHGTGQDIRLLVISMALAAGTRLHDALWFLSFLLSSFFPALHSYLLLLDIRSIDAGEASPPHASQLIQTRPTKEHVYAPVWGISQPLHLPVHRANLRNVRVSCKTNQLRLICYTVCTAVFRQSSLLTLGPASFTDPRGYTQHLETSSQSLITNLTEPLSHLPVSPCSAVSHYSVQRVQAMERLSKV